MQFPASFHIIPHRTRTFEKFPYHIFMPTPAQSAKVMLFNRGNKTGKHYTKTEIEKRKNAEEKIKRAEVVLKTPAFLKEKSCAAALKIWKEIIKEGKEIELFDNVDARILANFCRYQALFEDEAVKMFPDKKKLDMYGKQALSYAEKLGLTPTARARLVVKRANALNDDDEQDSMMA